MKIISENKKIKEEIVSIKISSKLPIIKINETVLVNSNILLEKGDKIRILKESYNFDDICRICNHEKCSIEIRGLLNYINANKGKYKNDINDFEDYFNNDLEGNIEDLDNIVKSHKPMDSMSGLPSNDWSFFRKFANNVDVDDEKNLLKWAYGK